MIIVAGLSADYEIEVRMLEKKPTGFDRAHIERIVRNQYNKLPRQQHDLKGFIGIGKHHHGGSRREEEFTQMIRGQLLQLRKEGSSR